MSAFGKTEVIKKRVARTAATMPALRRWYIVRGFGNADKRSEVIVESWSRGVNEGNRGV